MTAAIQYFLPGAPAQPNVAEWGLSHIGSSPSFRQCANGPGGQAGTLAAVGATPSYIRDQQWRKAPEKFAPRPWWICATGEIDPDTLARSKQLQGRPVTLADGKPWMVPMLREYRETDAEPLPVSYLDRLPRLIKLSEEGDYVYGDVLPEYREIWEQSLGIWKQIYESIIDHGIGELNLRDLFNFAIQCLSLNYRIGPVEVDCLGLMTEEVAQEIIAVALDVEGFTRAWGKAADRLASSATE